MDEYKKHLDAGGEHVLHPDGSKNSLALTTDFGEWDNSYTIDDLEKDKPEGDDFENVYKGEVSRSGIPILPSKRARKIPEKITIDKINKETESEQDSEPKDEISLEELKKEEEVKDEENESQKKRR